MKALRVALRWAIPGGLVLGVALGVERGLVGPLSLRGEVVEGYPWLVFAGAALLGWLFHRSRVVVAVAGLAALHWLIAGGNGGTLAAPLGTALLILVLGALSGGKDRGILSTGGLLQLGTAASVGLAGAFVAWREPERTADFLGRELLALDAGSISDPVLILLAAALVATFFFAYRREGPVERALLWTLLALAAASWVWPDVRGSVLYFMAGGLVLGLSVVETSYAMAYRDDLTGLPARRALMRDLEALGGTYAVAMVDVDRFKKFNDKHGHDVGDQVLRMVATHLRDAPGGAKAYRYGGEEFTLLFPGRTRDDAVPHLEEAREDVADARFALRSWTRPRKKPDKKKKRSGGKKLSVTVSMGVADSTGEGATPASVLKKADQALYRAKRKGRNRVAK